jgi:hypothetical protein
MLIINDISKKDALVRNIPLWDQCRRPLINTGVVEIVFKW